MTERDLHRLDSGEIKLTIEQALKTVRLLIKDKNEKLEDKWTTDDERQYFQGMREAYRNCEKILENC